MKTLLLPLRSVAFLTALMLLPVSAVPAQIPVMESLDRTDPVFALQQAQIREFYRRSSAGEELPELDVYRYTTRPEDTLFGISARLSVPYSAIATLNRMTSSDLGDPGQSLLLPSYPGVFLPLDPQTDLEVVVSDLRRDDESRIVTLPDRTRSGRETTFRFFPGSDFHPDERSTFLGVLFRPPLRSIVVTSPFGPRSHPVTGLWGFHAGVDLAGSIGTPVVAARSGIVTDRGEDFAMGKYVLIEHSGGFSTFYGHLDTITVALNDSVRSGMIIGTVGSTGITTGSHLHFEIRQGDNPRDPMKMLP